MKKWLTITAMIFLVPAAPAPVLHAARGGGVQWYSAAEEGKESRPTPNDSSLKMEESRATQIIGRYVKNLYGETLGKISDLLLDPEDPVHVVFAVLTQGGFLGVGGRLIAVPFSALTWNERDRVYELNMTRERLAQAPTFYRDHWPDLHHRAWTEEVYRYYGQNPHWMEE